MIFSRDLCLCRTIMLRRSYEQCLEDDRFVTVDMHLFELLIFRWFSEYKCSLWSRRVFRDDAL